MLSVAESQRQEGAFEAVVIALGVAFYLSICSSTRSDIDTMDETPVYALKPSAQLSRTHACSLNHP
jgi:hypothetical protein